jgi:hypothetical protein
MLRRETFCFQKSDQIAGIAAIWEGSVHDTSSPRYSNGRLFLLALAHTSGLAVCLARDSAFAAEIIPWRGRIRAMASAVSLQNDFSSAELRRLAAASKNASRAALCIAATAATGSNLGSR